MEKTVIVVSEMQKGLRIDRLTLEGEDGLSRNGFQKLIEDKKVLINGKIAVKSQKVNEGDTIEIEKQPPVLTDILPQDIPLNIVYEDEELLIVNKKQGMVVHPANGNFEGTLVNALLSHCKEGLSGINGEIRPGIVHRIDKNTSGLLIVAKNDFSHNFLAKQIKEHSFLRRYHAIVLGNIKKDEGTINAPIGRSISNRKKMMITEKNSKHAITHYRVLKRFNGFTYIECTLETGRTHQIRVHLSALGHPVLGDDVYGSQKNDFSLKGQLLHAKEIGFIHPKTLEFMHFDSELPDYFCGVLQRLENSIN